MSTQVLEARKLQNGSKSTGIALLVGYVAIYAATLYGMVRFGQFEAGDALGLFAVLGVGFSLAAWLLTLGMKPLPYRSEEHTSELQSLRHLVCRLLLEK